VHMTNDHRRVESVVHFYLKILLLSSLIVVVVGRSTRSSSNTVVKALLEHYCICCCIALEAVVELLCFEHENWLVTAIEQI
jgi:hypothetical protein